MHQIDLILTLTAGLTASLALGFLAVKLRFPPIVGYLFAGLLVGPHTPGFVADSSIAAQFAEVGVILLMFGVGLHFHLDDLIAVWRIALPAALGQIALATGLGAVAVHSLGWAWPAAIIFGIALSVASTVVLTRVLSDQGDLNTQAGQIALGIVVVEDLFTVLVLVALPTIMAAQGNLLSTLGMSAVRLSALGAIMLLAGSRYIPRFLGAIARTRSSELFTLAVLVLALGIAVASAELFGASMALGAFLGGMVVGKSEFSHRAASDALPMRDAFAVLFFVSVGMLFDPWQLLREPLDVVLALLVILISKPLVLLVLVLLFGYGPMVGTRVALGFAQIGEFSFLLATVATGLGVLPASATGALVSASIVSIALNPLIYRMAPRLEAWIIRHPTLRRWTSPRHLDSVAPPSNRKRAIVVGWGLVGQRVTGLLEESGMAVSVIERNIDTVRNLQREKRHAVYGDAARGEILESAGIGNAAALVVTPPAHDDAQELLRAARRLNPDLVILVRSAFASQADNLARAGADEVVSGEIEVANRMLETIRLRVLATHA